MTVLSSNPRILDSMRSHRFGVLIEITNGITNRKKRQSKKRQVREGRFLLEEALGDGIEVRAGIAVIKHNQDPIRELDFLVRISDYDATLLYGSASKVLEGGAYLNPDAAVFLSELMKYADDNEGPRTLRDVLNPEEGSLTVPQGIPRRGYGNRLAKVKGPVLEFYVRELFDDALQRSHAFALGTNLRCSNSGREAVTDLLIAADKTDFRNALAFLEEKYDGREKIYVESSL